MLSDVKFCMPASLKMISADIGAPPSKIASQQQQAAEGTEIQIRSLNFLFWEQKEEVSLQLLLYPISTPLKNPSAAAIFFLRILKRERVNAERGE
ncbi:hypothetical protein OIU74_024650, partial [Salix koriyanagi]